MIYELILFGARATIETRTGPEMFRTECPYCKEENRPLDPERMRAIKVLGISGGEKDSLLVNPHLPEGKMPLFYCFNCHKAGMAIPQ